MDKNWKCVHERVKELEGKAKNPEPFVDDLVDLFMFVDTIENIHQGEMAAASLCTILFKHAESFLESWNSKPRVVKKYSLNRYLSEYLPRKVIENRK